MIIIPVDPGLTSGYALASWVASEAQVRVMATGESDFSTTLTVIGGWLEHYRSQHPQVELPIVIVRVNRDEKFIAKLAEEMEKFSVRMEDLRLKLTQEYGPFERKLVPEPSDAYDGMGVSDEDIDVLMQNGAIVPKS